MAIHLVTGHAGTEHITSGDTGRLIAGIVGVGRYVLRTGTQLEATVVNSNLIRIGSGDAVDQGRHICIPAGSYEEAVIDNGSQGVHRLDVIAMRYTKDNGGVESASIVIHKGTAVSTMSTPTRPTCVSGDIIAGALVDDLPLYTVHIFETSIDTVQAVFSLAPSLSSVVDIVYPVGAIYMSTVDTHPEVLFPGTRWYTVSGRFLLGSSDSYVAGTRGGEASHVLTEAEMPFHIHQVAEHEHAVPEHTHRANVSNAPSHSHNVSVQKTAASGTARLVVTNDSGIGEKQTSPAGAHSHEITIYEADRLRTTSVSGQTLGSGQGAAHNNLPPYYVVNMWRRYA